MLDMGDLTGGSAGCLQPGMEIADFVVMECLGIGSLGETYLACDSSGQENTVIRLLSFQKNTPRDLEPGLKKLRASAESAKNRHLLGIRDARVEDFFCWVAYRKSDRIPVSGLLRERIVGGEGPFAEKEVRRMIFQTLLGLHALHEAGLVHGSVKPSHCFVDEEFRLELADAGLVPLLGFPSHYGRAGSEEEAAPPDLPGFYPRSRPLVESILFSAPENLEDPEHSVAGDLYAAGFLAWHLFTSRKRGGANFFYELPEEIRDTWGSWFLRALEFAPGDRFSNAEEMLAAMPGVEAA